MNFKKYKIKIEVLAIVEAPDEKTAREAAQTTAFVKHSCGYGSMGSYG